ncbi:hypothetical protein WDW89_17865 [Deltaproteobacteria bacterium TL4]
MFFAAILRLILCSVLWFTVGCGVFFQEDQSSSGRSLPQAPDASNDSTPTEGVPDPIRVLDDFPSSSQLTATSIEILFQLNKPGILYYVVQRKDTEIPSATQIQAGGANKLTELAGSLSIMTAKKEQVLSLTNLTVNTAYQLYYFVQSLDDSMEQTLVKNFAFQTTTLAVPPFFLEGFPQVLHKQSNQFDILVQLDRESLVYYLILRDKTSTPSVSDVIAGTDSKGNPGVASGSGVAGSTTNDLIFHVENLQESTTYYLYFVAQTRTTPPILQAKITPLETMTTPASIDIPETGLSVHDMALPDVTALSAQVLSEPVRFEIPPDTISYILYLFTPYNQVNNSILIDTLKTPTGVIFTSQSQAVELDYLVQDLGFVTVMAPKRSGVSIEAGTWTYDLSSTKGIAVSELSMKIAMRRGTLQNPPTLLIKPFLASTHFQIADLEESLSIMKQIFVDNGIVAFMDPVEVLTETGYAVVQENFNAPETSSMISLGAADKVNLFLVDDIVNTSGNSLLGISAGIPGSQGIKGNRNGIMISLEAHQLGGSSNPHPRLLGETCAHEMGHWLGLFHTSEADGSYQDLQSDTPECTLASDVNHNSEIDPNECAAGINLMFWTSGYDPYTHTLVEQNTLTPEQVDIIHRSPITR